MRRGPRRPGDSGFRGVGLEVAGGDERDVEDLPPLLGRDRILAFVDRIGASDPRLDDGRHRQGRIRSVTPWRNSTTIRDGLPFRPGSRADERRFYDDVGRSGPAGRRDLHPDPARQVPEAGRVIGCFSSLASATEQRVNVIACQRAPATGSSFHWSGPGSAYPAATPEQQRCASAPGSTLGRRSTRGRRQAALWSGKRMALRFSAIALTRNRSRTALLISGFWGLSQNGLRPGVIRGQFASRRVQSWP